MEPNRAGGRIHRALMGEVAYSCEGMILGCETGGRRALGPDCEVGQCGSADCKAQVI